MAAVTDVDLLSTLHYTFQARPHYSNLMSGFFNVPCQTKLLMQEKGPTVYSFLSEKTRMSIHFLIL